MVKFRKAFSDFFSFIDRNQNKILFAILFLQAVSFVLLFLNFGVITSDADVLSYKEPAITFLRTGKMTYLGEPILTRTPGYILFLSAVYLVTGYSDLAVVILQIIITLLTTYLIFLSVKEISGSGTAACLGSFFFISDFVNYHGALCVLSDTLFSFLILLAFWLFIKYTKTEKLRFAVLSFLSLNYAMLVRVQIMYYLMAAAAVLLVLSILRKVGFKLFIIFICIFAVTYGGWSMRNFFEFGRPVFTSIRQEGAYLWYAPELYKLKENADGKEARDYFEGQLFEKYPDYDSLPKLERIDAQNDIGTTYISDNFGYYILLNLKGLGTEMIGPNMEGINNLQVPSVLQKLFALFVGGMLLLSYIIYAAGFLLNIKRQKGTDWFILLTVMYLMASTAVLGYSRFRMAFIPLCLIGTFTCWENTKKNAET